jgi:hypothetical protein
MAIDVADHEGEKQFSLGPSPLRRRGALEHDGRFDGSSEKSSPKTQRRKYREGYFESRYTSQ